MPNTSLTYVGEIKIMRQYIYTIYSITNNILNLLLITPFLLIHQHSYTILSLESICCLFQRFPLLPHHMFCEYFEEQKTFQS